MLALYGKEVELAGSELVGTFQSIGRRPAGNEGASPTPASGCDNADEQNNSAMRRGRCIGPQWLFRDLTYFVKSHHRVPTRHDMIVKLEPRIPGVVNAYTHAQTCVLILVVLRQRI